MELPDHVRPVDPLTKAARLGRERMRARDVTLCDEWHLVPGTGGEIFVHIMVDAETWPHPVPADLGRRVADMIRADLQGAADV